MTPYLIYLAVGVVAGIFSGAFGIGAGAIMIPIFVYLFKMSQHQAQGTALAVMLPPVFILAVWRYWKAGHVMIPMAAAIAVGFTIGGLIGAQIVQGVPDPNLKRAFGLLIVVVGLKMLF